MTLDEARERAALLSDVSYALHFDLTDHGGFDGVRELRIENALERVLESVSA